MSRNARVEALRRLADEVIGPVDGGYLRPWMCADDPAAATVLLTGANPATPFPVEAIDRAAYVDALVAGGAELGDLYLRVRAGSPSPTRRNIDALVAMLARHGVGPVLDTNVWTLPTRDLASLRKADRDVVERSTGVVPALVDLLHPRVLIVHGATATRGLAGLLGRELSLATRTAPIVRAGGSPGVVVLPSLSPPVANGWLPRSWVLLEELAADLAP